MVAMVVPGADALSGCFVNAVNQNRIPIDIGARRPRLRGLESEARCRGWCLQRKRCGLRSLGRDSLCRESNGEKTEDGEKAMKWFHRCNQSTARKLFPRLMKGCTFLCMKSRILD